MPSYEYQCPVHGVFETIQSITAPALEECPTCAEEGRKQWECSDCHSMGYSPKDVDLSKCSSKECAGSYLPGVPVKPKKLISLSSFALVGSGWAKDNYK